MPERATKKFRLRLIELQPSSGQMRTWDHKGHNSPGTHSWTQDKAPGPMAGLWGAGEGTGVQHTEGR